MANEKKKFNYGLYAVAAFAVVTVIIVLITIFTFKSKYIAFDEEKVAVNYTDTVIQKGDGYNAYKYTVLSQGDKYGDFIRKQYIYPVVYPGYEPGGNTDDFKGLDSDEHKSDKTANDDGSLAGQLADAMYPYYVELIETYGWDNYDAIFTNYISKLVETRKAVFGDDYMSDEVFFTAFESNVSTYGNSLTGTEEVIADDEKTVLQEESTGLYQTLYGKDYKISETVSNVEKIADLDSYKAALDSNTLATYDVSADDISEAAAVTVDIALEDGTVISQVTVNEIKIGNTWYVDNLTTDTSAMYINTEAAA
ncbi:MAG: hypothetical protein ACLUFN_09265 [Eubacterium sp.]